MQQLPRGYYAVQSDFSGAPKESFTFRGVSYAVTEGVNLFATLADAVFHAEETPETVLDGLPYDDFSVPVILCSAGKHINNRRITKFVIDRPVLFLGEGTGINPNLPTGNPLELPLLNPARAEGESVILGDYWWGDMLVQGDVNFYGFDGFTFENARLRDLREDGPVCEIVFRNIIEAGPCGRQLFRIDPPKAGSSIYRRLILQNIRSVGYDDYGYGGVFAQLSAQEVILDGICFADTDQIFGFSMMSHNTPNCPPNAEKAVYTIRNSYFRGLRGEDGISTGCRRNGAVELCISDSVFVDASRENEAVINPHLANDRCSLTLARCTFVDTRENASAAVAVFGEGRAISVSDCTFRGFAGEWMGLPVPSGDAPAYIENRSAAWMTETADPHRILGEAEADFGELDELYAGTKVYYGDLHVHTACGGTSDGAFPMTEWPRAMEEKQLDFAAVVDHRQMRGFFLPEWDEERFIIGTEPAAILSALNACRHNQCEIHFNMLFPHKYGLAMVLANFPEFKFSGDELTGTFSYPHVPISRFREISDYVQSIGGIMVHPHPKTMLSSDDPLDYYFGEHMFLETLYAGYASHASAKNYDLWVSLLALGRHVWSSCGSDTHGAVNNGTVATFYTREKSGRAFFDQMHSADFTSGAVGIKMCIDGNPMGSELAYREGMRLTLRLDDFYPPAWRENTAYELRIITDRGLAYASTYNGKLPQAISLAVAQRAFYRAEVYDLTHGYRIAIGNPIWLDG